MLILLGLAACSPAGQEAARNDAAPAAEAPAGPAPPVLEKSPEPATAQAGDDWRAYAKADDADRLQRLDEAWRTALAEASGENPKRFGALLDPAAGLPTRPQPTPGDYRCRTVKLGSAFEGGLTLTAYPYFKCRVAIDAGGTLSVRKLSGSQRFDGKLFPGTDPARNLVYLGTQAWGDETAFPAYGADDERDQIGLVERIADTTWRLVLPFPRQESKLDVVELAR